MYLECDCGSEFMLARYLMPPWYTPDELGPRLDSWFVEHQHCQQGTNYPAKPRLTYGSDGAPSVRVAEYMKKVRAGEIKMGAALDV